MTEPKTPASPPASSTSPAPVAAPVTSAADATAAPPEDYPDPSIEDGGPKGPDPARYNDWTLKGIAVDF